MSNAAKAISSQPSGMNGTTIQTSPAMKIRKAMAGIMYFFTVIVRSLL